MTKSTLAAAATALVLCSFTSSVASADALPSRVAASLGQAIAAQGNLALIQIRRDIKRSALKTIEPFLPAPDDSKESSTADQPANTPVAQR